MRDGRKQSCRGATPICCLKKRIIIFFVLQRDAAAIEMQQCNILTFPPSAHSPFAAENTGRRNEYKNIVKPLVSCALCWI